MASQSSRVSPREGSTRRRCVTEDWEVRLKMFDHAAVCIYDALNTGRLADAVMQVQGLRNAVARCQVRQGFAYSDDMSEPMALYLAKLDERSEQTQP